MKIRYFIQILAVAALAACQPSGSPSGDPEESAVTEEKVGTSPYTNCSFDSAASGENFDTVILNGRVMDPECGFDGMRNVGIKDGRIALITEGEISGADSIDATGHVVAPGFIDPHQHTWNEYGQHLLIQDGVTTGLDLEYGALNVPKFYESMVGESFFNYGLSVAHEAARIAVMDNYVHDKGTDARYVHAARTLPDTTRWRDDIPSDEELAEILALLEQGLQDGAIGASSTVGYFEAGATTNEVFKVQKLNKQWNRVFSSHTRGQPEMPPPREYSMGSRETIANQAAIQGAGWHSHIQRSGWDEIYELLQGLQKQGMVAVADIYPYVSGLPNAAAVPLEFFDMIGQEVEESLMDPVTGEYLNLEQLKDLHENNPQKIVVVFMGEAAEEGWAKMEDISYAADSVPVMDEEFNTLPLDHPKDEYVGHPRIIGTRSKMFRLAREHDVPLMNTVNNASYVPAKYLSMLGLPGMQERGRMQEGMVADITIFNPDTIRDNSTFALGERALQPTGIPHVIIGGQFVVRDGVVDLDSRPGQPIRYPVAQD